MKKISDKLYPSAAEAVEQAQKSKISEQSRSTAYRLAYDDLDLLLRDELRPVRLLLESTKPELHFLLRAKALVVFPGGYGTLDELFDALTLVQTRKIKPMPILLFGRDYWQRVINFDFLLEEGMVSEEDLQYVQYVEEAGEALDIIKSKLADLSGS